MDPEVLRRWSDCPRSSIHRFDCGAPISSLVAHFEPLLKASRCLLPGDKPIKVMGAEGSFLTEKQRLRQTPSMGVLPRILKPLTIPAPYSA